jgi:uncharacterized protein
MPLFRLFIIALIIGGVIYLYRRIKGRPPTQQQPQERSTRAVKCELCGLHVPEHEAVRRDDHVYCCRDHADKAAR